MKPKNCPHCGAKLDRRDSTVDYCPKCNAVIQDQQKHTRASTNTKPSPLDNSIGNAFDNWNRRLRK